jgi:hypothetical protein
MRHTVQCSANNVNGEEVPKSVYERMRDVCVRQLAAKFEPVRIAAESLEALSHRLSCQFFLHSHIAGTYFHWRRRLGLPVIFQLCVPVEST